MSALTSLVASPSLWHRLFDFDDYGALLVLGRNSLCSGSWVGSSARS